MRRDGRTTFSKPQATSSGRGNSCFRVDTQARNGDCRHSRDTRQSRKLLARVDKWWYLIGSMMAFVIAEIIDGFAQHAFAMYSELYFPPAEPLPGRIFLKAGSILWRAARSPRELVAEHRQAAPRLLARGLVLDHVPVLGQSRDPRSLAIRFAWA